MSQHGIPFVSQHSAAVDSTRRAGGRHCQQQQHPPSLPFKGGNQYENIVIHTWYWQYKAVDNRYDISAIPIRHFIQYRIARYGLPCERTIIALSRHDLQQPHAVMVELLLLCILRALRLAARPTRTRATPPLTFCLRSLVFSDLSFLPSFSFFDMSARAFLRSRFSFSFAAAFRLRSMIMSYSPRTLRASSSASTDFPSQCSDNTRCLCWMEL